MAVQRSVVKWFDAKKGFGFIVNPDNAEDIFVHYSSINSDRRFKTLRTGQVVEFELKDGPKGLHAQDVLPFDEYEDVEEPSSFSPPRYDDHDRPFDGHDGSLDGQYAQPHPPMTSSSRPL